MIIILVSNPSVGGYRAHDFLFSSNDATKIVKNFLFCPKHNIIKA